MLSLLCILVIRLLSFADGNKYSELDIRGDEIVGDNSLSALTSAFFHGENILPVELPAIVVESGFPVLAISGCDVNICSSVKYMHISLLLKELLTAC